MLLLQRKAIEPDMTWFKVDDSLHSHPKVLATEPAAMGLWVIAGSWSSDNLTEGFVPDHVLPRLLPDSSKLARALVAAGLWRRVQGGYAFHDWTDYNPTAAQVRKDRAANAERQARFRAAQRNSVSNAVTNSSSNGVTNASPSRPVPSQVDVVNQSSRRNARDDPPALTAVAKLADSFARVLDDNDLLSAVIRSIHAKTCRSIEPDDARRIAADILGSAKRQVADPIAYVTKAIEREKDPIGRWLDRPAEYQPVMLLSVPSSLPAVDQHAYEPGPSGVCATCDFPEANRSRHAEVS